MRIVRYRYQNEEGYGASEGSLLKIIEGDLWGDFKISDRTILLKEVKVLPPVIASKVVAVGLNYAKHVTELAKDREVPKEPLLFMKPSTSIIGPDEKIVRPRKSDDLHYEGELAVVMKRRAKGIETREVRNYVLGYAC